MTVEERTTLNAPGAAFSEGYVEADGFRIRYLEAGQGTALIHLHGAGGLQLTPAHDLLSERFRVVAFEMPGFSGSPENVRTRSTHELAVTMSQAIANLGIQSFNLLGSSFGSRIALRLALHAPESVLALVLEGPADIRSETRAGLHPTPRMATSEDPEQMQLGLDAHPERPGYLPAFDPAVQAKNRAFTARLRGSSRDPEFERRLSDLATPVLVLFGTDDLTNPPEIGRFYQELLPNCNLVFVYDAGHVISMDRPQAFVEVAGDFLDRHEAFVISRRDTVILP